MDRRHFVGAVVGLGVGIGAVNVLDRGGGGSTTARFERASDPNGFDEESTETSGGNRSATVVTEFELPQGTYDYTDWSISQQVWARVEVFCEDNPVEFFVIDERELDRFEDGEEVSHYQDFHGTGRAFDSGGPLPTGSYYLVMDNSTFGDQSPGGDVRGEIELTIER